MYVAFSRVHEAQYNHLMCAMYFLLYTQKCTSLHVAAVDGHEQVAVELLCKGANPRLRLAGTRTDNQVMSI